MKTETYYYKEWEYDPIDPWTIYRIDERTGKIWIRYPSESIWEPCVSDKENRAAVRRFKEITEQEAFMYLI